MATLPSSARHNGEATARCALGVVTVKEDLHETLNQPNLGDMLRLGKHARDILVQATAEWSDFEPGATAAIRSARSRALNRLVRHGLIERSRLRRGIAAYELQILTECGPYNVPVRRWHYVQQIRLSPLGARIVERYRSELANGRPLRWKAWAIEGFQAALADQASAWAMRERRS